MLFNMVDGSSIKSSGIKVIKQSLDWLPESLETKWGAKRLNDCIISTGEH